MPLFKKSFKDAWAQAGADMDQEFARVMDFPPVADIATELMAAFGPDGPKSGKPLTLNDLREWCLTGTTSPTVASAWCARRGCGAAGEARFAKRCRCSNMPSSCI